MFTGLVEEIGNIRSIEERPAGRRLWIHARLVLEGARVGDSIAVDGCCLTATALDARGFSVEAVPETLRRTTLGECRAGEPINLERPLRFDQRLGGHLVQGHIDGVAVVQSIVAEGDGARVRFDLPAGLARFVAEKGSIALDGVSLTVAAVDADACEVAFIPHTLAVTVAGRYAAGRRVNVEVDLIARYLARFLEGAEASGGRP